MDAVVRAKEYIIAGDIFQIVLSQRFERRTFAHPFEVYRSTRVVNPSPYMAYLQVRRLLRLNFSLKYCFNFSMIQARGCVLVASSPEMLIRVKNVSSGRFVDFELFLDMRIEDNS